MRYEICPKCLPCRDELDDSITEENPQGYWFHYCPKHKTCFNYYNSCKDENNTHLVRFMAYNCVYCCMEDINNLFDDETVGKTITHDNKKVHEYIIGEIALAALEIGEYDKKNNITVSSFDLNTVNRYNMIAVMYKKGYELAS